MLESKVTILGTYGQDSEFVSVLITTDLKMYCLDTFLKEDLNARYTNAAERQREGKGA